MSCYLCGEEAVVECPICHRKVCQEHLTCTNCSDWAKTKSLRMRQKWCDFCEKETEETTYRCAKCGKRFCPEHGQLVHGTLPGTEVKPGGVAKKENLYCRCVEHLKIPDRLGVGVEYIPTWKEIFRKNLDETPEVFESEVSDDELMEWENTMSWEPVLKKKSDGD